MNQAGGGALGTHSWGLKPLRVTAAGGGGNRQLGLVSGTVTTRVVRLVPMPSGQKPDINGFREGDRVRPAALADGERVQLNYDCEIGGVPYTAGTAGTIHYASDPALRAISPQRAGTPSTLDNGEILAVPGHLS